MKVSLLFIVFALLPLLTPAQSTNQIVIGQIDSLQSKILNEKRKIWVHIPESYRNGTYAQRYPVVYLLDGSGHFSSVVGMIEQLSAVNGNTICPEMIVVGIPNTNRTRDLTPTHVKADPPYIDSSAGKSTGGGEKFISFIEKELIPHIDSLYPTRPYKTFIGHSLGGLMVIQSLVHHPALFNAYVAIDPSMWWDKRRLLNEAKSVLPTGKYTGKSLFLGIANTVRESGLDTVQVQKDTATSTNHLRSILTLHHLFKTNSQNGLRYKGTYYGTDSHGSVPLISEYDALHFIFENYNLDLTEQDLTNDDGLTAQKFSTHFAAVSKSWGFPVSPPEEMVNSLGYFALSRKLYRKTESLFKLNIANYPQSYNAYDSMGDYYVARKDTANAIVNFQQSLALKETAETRKKLTQLQAKANVASGPSSTAKRKN